MLDHLRDRVTQTLAKTQTATLATFGPADIQANVFPCEGLGTTLYLLVPRTSDHLLNIESNPRVVATAIGWQAQGQAEVLSACPPALMLGQRPDAQWCCVIQMALHRLHIAADDQGGPCETIDLL